jgi:hypothetical protein
MKKGTVPLRHKSLFLVFLGELSIEQSKLIRIRENDESVPA